jgi:alpha-L-fucosidase
MKFRGLSGKVESGIVLFLCLITFAVILTGNAEALSCSLRGDYSPCGEVTITEVINLINKWIADEASITEVIQLINAWAEGALQPPFTVCVNGSMVSANDANGRLIANGTAGVDDAAVINRALESLPADRMRKENVILEGNFTARERILIPSYTIFNLRGRITAVMYTNALYEGVIQNSGGVAGNKEIELSGGTYDNNRSSHYLSVYTNVAGLKINGVTFTQDDTNDSGAVEIRSQGVDIVNCTFRHIWIVNVIDGAKDVMIRNCTFKDLYDSGLSIGTGMPYPVYDMRNISVINNTMELDEQALGFGVEFFGNVYDSTVEDNTIRRPYLDGIILHGGPLNPGNITIKNNDVSYAVRDHRAGVKISGNPDVSNVSIINNTLHGNYDGIEIWNANHINITDNKCYNNNNAGISIFPNNENSTGYRIINNSVYDDQTPKTQLYGIHFADVTPYKHVFYEIRDNCATENKDYNWLIFSRPISSNWSNNCNMSQDWNDDNRVQEYMDMGFGMFIHWGPISQDGWEISWPVYGASTEYRDYYYSIYKTFDPVGYDPAAWADLAKEAGMEYVIFTTKHHDGFCMYDSRYTNYSIMNSLYGKDIAAELAQAYRSKGIAIGWYYSSDDWRYQYEKGFNGTYLGGMELENYNQPFGTRNLTLLEYEKQQVRELLTNYGPIDLMWFDWAGPRVGRSLQRTAWETNPECIVVRGEIDTPEREIHSTIVSGPWETCMTMGQQWAYKPDDVYKTPEDLIHELVQVRAKGGNFLLNVGPNASGQLPDPQKDLLRELASWNAVNSEAIHSIRPWKTANESDENDIWFTQNKNGDIVYAIFMEWPIERTAHINSLAGYNITDVRLLGSDETLEWSAGTDLTVSFPDDDHKPLPGYAYTLKITIKK